jgi:hypothetical protein
MGLPRDRLTIGTLMILVAIAAVWLAALAFIWNAANNAITVMSVIRSRPE